MKPRVRLQGYDSSRYTVLVALKSGTVYVASAYSYKPAAYRMAQQRSPSRNQRTYRTAVVPPGASLADTVNWLIKGLPEVMSRYWKHITVNITGVPRPPD